MKYIFILVMLSLSSCKAYMDTCYETNIIDVDSHYQIQFDTINSNFHFSGNGAMTDLYLEGKYLKRGKSIELISKKGHVVKTSETTVDSVYITIYDFQNESQPLPGIYLIMDDIKLDSLLTTGKVTLPAPANCKFEAMGYSDFSFTFNKGIWNVYLYADVANESLLKWKINPNSNSIINNQGFILEKCTKNKD